MSLQDDFNGFQTQIGDTIGDENPLELYFRKMWEETEVEATSFLRTTVFNYASIDRIVVGFIKECEGSDFRKSLYTKRWRTLVDQREFNSWLGELKTCIDNVNERRECLAAYVTRILQGDFDPCNGREAGTSLSEIDCVWEQAFGRLTQNCNNWRI